jgi:hypothetical protein
MKSPTQPSLVAHDATPIEKLSAWYRRLNSSFKTVANDALATNIANRMSALRYVLTLNEHDEVVFVRLHTREHKTWLTNREDAYKPPPKQLTRAEWLIAHRQSRLGKDHPDDRRARKTGDATLAVAVAKVCHEMHRKLMEHGSDPSIIRYGKKGPAVIDIKTESALLSRPQRVTVICPGVLVRYSPVPHFLFTNTRGKEYVIEFDSEIGREMIGRAVARKIIGDE